MPRQLPRSYTAGRPLNLGGQQFDRGNTIAVEILAKVRNLTSLLSRRWIVPSTDNYGRPLKNPATGSPVRVFAAERRALLDDNVPTIRHNTAWGTEPLA